MIDKLIQLSDIFKEGFTVEINDNRINQYSNTDKPYILSYQTLIEIRLNSSTIFHKVKLPNKCIIGGWLDNDTSTYYIELNKTYKNKSYALRMAKKYNQKAIYNSNTGEVIYVQ